MALVAEIETDNRMRDPRRAPPGDKQVGAAELCKIVRTSLPLAGVVTFGTVGAGAEVVDDYLIAIDVGVGGLRIVGLPVAKTRSESSDER